VSADGRYSAEPADKLAFSQRFDRLYSRTARAYDLAVKLLPLWRRWLRSALPHIRGPRVLEVSFGTGWLLTQYAGLFEAYGIELNEAMLEVAQRNLKRAGLAAELRIGNVEGLPFDDQSFDTVLSTMAFSGYPDARAAMAELHRVLKPGGRLVMIDVGYPRDGNRLGTALVGFWRRSGDLIRDMHTVFPDFELRASDEEVGGFGSVHLYLATKRDTAEAHSCR
jgi:ubiquinone/menaquinone biosynthesis C-methylase UbiE